MTRSDFKRRHGYTPERYVEIGLVLGLFWGAFIALAITGQLP